MRTRWMLTLTLALLGLAFAQGVFLRVNLNTASREQLELLPGVGPKLSLEIVKRRPYRDGTSFQNRVPGIGPAAWARLERFVVFSGETLIKINVNTASRDDLEFLPGVGPKIAAEIVKHRPYRDADDFIRKVPGLGADDWARLRPYVVFDAR